jgi:hypothetical protein
MIVRNLPNGEQLVLGQTDHSRLAGRFAAHWGNGTFAALEPYESVVRAATFHDFGYLRYETTPAFNPESHQTPNFRDVVTDEKRLAEYQEAFDWFLGPDPYAATLARMHRTGLWRGRYDAMVHPEHKIRKQPPEVDRFVAKNEAIREQTVAQNGWDKQQLRINYRLLQVWDLMSLHFSCSEPTEDYLFPVPTRYTDREGEGARIEIKPLDATTVALTPYPFDEDGLRIQLPVKRFRNGNFNDREAFIKAYFQAGTELLEYTLVDGAQRVRGAKTLEVAASR